nr:LuxR C-terminal-related transcriptional regulator [Halomonas socia]
MDSEHTMVILITDANPQSQLFVDYINNEVECSVSTLPPDAHHQELSHERVVLLIDADHVHESDMHEWHLACMESPAKIMSVFNLKDEEHAMDIMRMLHIHGVFYRNDPIALICKGIGALIEGDFWMSRSLMTRLIDFYRHQQLSIFRPACGLTQREMEIISLLASGDSNLEIAEKLFVSEHTVKSHIYNIFRKIKVHNRIQAMNWAKKNLMTTPRLPILSNKGGDSRRNHH